MKQQPTLPDIFVMALKNEIKMETGTSTVTFTTLGLWNPMEIQ